MIRPDDIIHDDDSPQSAKVLEKIFFGSDFLYKLELTEGEKIFCYTPSHHNHNEKRCAPSHEPRAVACFCRQAARVGAVIRLMNGVRVCA